jgi:hypothetical protein
VDNEWINGWMKGALLGDGYKFPFYLSFTLPQFQLCHSSHFKASNMPSGRSLKPLSL